MCEQYAGRLISLYPQLSVLCLFTGAHFAEPAWLRKRATPEAVATLSAGEVFKHIGSDIGVDVFYRVEKQAVHGYHLYEIDPSRRMRRTMNTDMQSLRPCQFAPALRRRR